MLTFTLPPEQPRALTVPLGRTVDRRAAWRERAEAAAQASLHAAYTGQSALTVAGRRAEYQPMRNGIDKGLKQDHNAYTNGDSDHA